MPPTRCSVASPSKPPRSCAARKRRSTRSGFVGGHKHESVKARRARRPELLVEHAVKGMIPHNKLGRAVYTKLKVYAGAEHPHEAQQPQELKLPEAEFTRN